MKKAILLLFIALAGFRLSAQTCCSSGIPIASNLGFQSQGAKVLQFSLGFEQNRLNSLFNEKSRLEDNNRLRITNTGLVRVSYGVHKYLNIEALIPYVSQVRRITQNNGELDEEGGHGIGDVTILAESTFIQKDFSSFSLGAGIKIPTGANDLRNSAGFLLINDLQLGSATYDYLLRGAFSSIPAGRPSSSIFVNSTFIYKGINERYLGSQTYKFGNEIQATLGYSDQFFFHKTLFYPSASVRFRRAIRDEINNNELTNTGGTWLFGRLALGLEIFKGSRVSLTTEFPLYTFVDGIQLSPSLVYNVSFYKSFYLGRKDDVKLSTF